MITVFEHETRAFDGSPGVLRALERLCRTGPEILRVTSRGGRPVLQATEYVGVVHLGGLAVQVLPKFHRGETAVRDDQVLEATRNLLHMLSFAGEFPVREAEVAPLLRRGRGWFEVLTRLFASHLTTEWRRGAHRGYDPVEDESPALRGRWRVADQIRRPERLHRLSVAYDSLTADNPLNRVFRYVVERLWLSTKDPRNRRMLAGLRQGMEGVTLPASVALPDADPRRLLTRLNARYRPLLNLARTFIGGNALQLAIGHETAFAFVVDMNRLFEAFVVQSIRRHREQVLPPGLRGCRLLKQSLGAPHHAARRETRPVFPLRPDLVFQSGNRFPLLLDAKYKVLDPGSRRLGVAPDDFYQMFVYAHRYACDRVLMIYPQTADSGHRLRAGFRVEGGDKVIGAATVDLRRDLRKETPGLVAELRAILEMEA